MTLDKVSKVGLLNLLTAAIDGIDGYESETGDLRYWDKKMVEQARHIIDQMTIDASV